MYGSIYPHLDVLMRGVGDFHSCYKYTTIYISCRIYYIVAKLNLSQFVIEENMFIFTVWLYFGFLPSGQNSAKLEEFWKHCVAYCDWGWVHILIIEASIEIWLSEQDI